MDQERAADENEQDEINRQLIEQGNREWVDQQAEMAAAAAAAVPSTPPNLPQDAGTNAIDPDLLSPRLERMTLAPSTTTAEAAPQELDLIPTTALRQKVRISQR